MKFTDKSVQFQPPRADRYDVRDELNPGFALWVFPNRSKSWAFIYHYQGTQTTDDARQLSESIAE